MVVVLVDCGSGSSNSTSSSSWVLWTAVMVVVLGIVRLSRAASTHFELHYHHTRSPYSCASSFPFSFQSFSVYGNVRDAMIQWLGAVRLVFSQARLKQLSADQNRNMIGSHIPPEEPLTWRTSEQVRLLSCFSCFSLFRVFVLSCFCVFSACLHNIACNTVQDGTVSCSRESSLLLEVISQRWIGAIGNGFLYRREMLVSCRIGTDISCAGCRWVEITVPCEELTRQYSLFDVLFEARTYQPKLRLCHVRCYHPFNRNVQLHV